MSKGVGVCDECDALVETAIAGDWFVCVNCGRRAHHVLTPGTPNNFTIAFNHFRDGESLAVNHRSGDLWVVPIPEGEQHGAPDSP